MLLVLMLITACAMLVLSPHPPLYGDIPISTAWYDREGRLLRFELASDERFRLTTQLHEMPTDLIKATLLQEDRFFYNHPGVNPFSLLRAAYETYIRRTRPVGGSTITMQLVRLRDNLKTRSIPGKLRQIWRALVLERHYSKAEILEAYLSMAPYGGNIEGIHAAALIYFNRKPLELALPQIMTLVVIPQNPARRFPMNFDSRFMGPMPADEALRLSRNVPAISLATKLANPDLYTFLQDAGLGLPYDQSHYGLSLAVGGAEVNMRNMVKLYAMLANGGRLSSLRAISDAPKGPARQVLSRETAYLTLKMLERPFAADVTMFSTETQRVPVYWKTGTSSGMRDAWTVGVFGPYVLAVWVGHFDGRRNPALVGREIAAPLFFRIVNAVSAHELVTDQVQTAIDKLNITRVALCRDRLSSEQKAGCTRLEESLFIAGKSPIAPLIATERLSIISPAEGVQYALSQQNAPVQQLPLEAKYDRQRYPLFWFVGQQLIGISKDGHPLFWKPSPGVHVIRVLDKEGNSDAATIRIIASH